jgi:prepilin-type N-terminal cleavage/methylation domain-containing protein
MNKIMKDSGFTLLEIPENLRRKTKFLTGFTLIEIMVVVAILVVLTSLAVPNFLRSRITANEGAVIASLRIISNACQLYYQSNKTYPKSLIDLTEPASFPPYLDSTLASGKKHGYEFIYRFVDSEHFTLNADPLSPGRTEIDIFIQMKRM